MIGVRLTLLGPVRAFLDNAAIDLGGPRQRGVLAVLAVARGQLVPADHLTDALWPAAGRPSDPAASLHTFVSRLRRALQPDSSARARGQVLVSRGAGYALRLDQDAVDIWRFERLVGEGSALTDTEPAVAAARLEQALELWRGPPPADYAEDEWAQAEIARLTELRAVARERLLAAPLALGDAAVSGAGVHEVGQKLFLTPTSVERHLEAARRRGR
jgi:DNA-binding SARP family transcriptional activator